MGKGQSPTREELEFVYQHFLQGCSDAEILKKYEESKKHGKLGSMPYRTDVRFIRQRRKEYEAARKILEGHLKRQVDPIAARAKEEHLAEIRSLIEEWRNRLDTSWFGTISFETPSRPMQDLEHNPLFSSLEEHLPFPNLWQDYSVWTAKMENYVDGCKELLKNTRQEAKTSQDPETMKIADDIGRASTAEALALTEPLAEMMRRYGTKAKSQFAPLLDEIRALRDKLRDSLQEILLSRGYIMYTCKRCPG